MQQHITSVSSTTAFNFNPNLLEFSSNIPLSIPYTVSGFGATVSSTAPFLWNSGTTGLPAAGTLNLTPGAPVTLPINNSSLPNFFFDAIITFTYLQKRVIWGFTNSPDSLALAPANNTSTNKILCWTNLHCFGAGSVLGNNSTLANYMRFATPATQNGMNNTGFTIRLSSPAPEAVTFTLRITYPNGYIQDVYIPVAQGAISSTATSIPFVTGNLLTTGTGWYTLRIVIPDENIYHSLLPLYHWGVG